MTFSKKIVAITAVAASGVMGFDMKNMGASAGPDGASASMGGMSVSAGPDGAKADMKDGAKPLSPAAKAASARIPKDKTAEEIAELLKKEQKGCKNMNAEAMPKLMAEAFGDLGNMMNITPGTDNSQASNNTPAPTEAPVPAGPVCPFVNKKRPGMYANTKYCKNVAFTNCLRAYQRHHNGNLIQNARFNSDFDIDSNSHCAKLTSDLFRSEILDLLEQAQEHPYFQGPRRQLFDMNMDMNMDGMQQGGMQLPGLPGGLPATEEMCLKQVKGIHAELCSADSATEGSYLNRFSCDDAITVCTAAGVDSESMPQCMTSGAIAGTVIGVLLLITGILVAWKLGACHLSEERKQELIAAKKLADERRAEKEARENPQPVVVVVSESTQMKIEMEKLRLANEELRLQNADLESQVSSKTSFEKMQDRVRANAAI